VCMTFSLSDDRLDGASSSSSTGGADSTGSEDDRIDPAPRT
jgi:hypothetical protein